MKDASTSAPSCGRRSAARRCCIACGRNSPPRPKGELHSLSRLVPVAALVAGLFAVGQPAAQASLVYTPDAQIRASATASYLGDDVYNADGTGQTVLRRAKPGYPDVFRVRIQNDGDTGDTIELAGTGDSAGFKVSYFVRDVNDPKAPVQGAYGGDAEEVTDAVVAGTYVTPYLQVGQMQDVFIVIAPSRRVSPGTVKRVELTATTTFCGICGTPSGSQAPAGLCGSPYTGE